MHANEVLTETYTIYPRGVGGPMGGAGRGKNGGKPVVLVVHADDQTGRTASRDGWSRGTARRKYRRERWARGRRTMAESAGRRGWRRTEGAGRSELGGRARRRC